MTIDKETTSWPFSGDGVTTQFPYDNVVWAKSDLLVLVDQVPVDPGDYSVTGLGNKDGGNVVFNTAPVAGAVGDIRSVIPYTQGTDYQDGKTLPADTKERGLDRLTRLVQQARALALEAAAGPFVWRFTTPTGAADPGAGQFRMNAAPLGAITALYVSNTTLYGINVTDVLKDLPSGTKILLSQIGDPRRAELVQTSAAVTDNGAWSSIPVTALASGTTGFIDKAPVAFQIVT